MSDLAKNNLGVGPGKINMTAKAWQSIVSEKIFDENSTVAEVAGRIKNVEHGGHVADWVRVEIGKTCVSEVEAQHRIHQKLERGRRQHEEAAAQREAALRKLVEQGGV